MYNYSFRPTFPLFHRSAQFFLAAGVVLALAGVAYSVGKSDYAYTNLPYLIASMASFLGFIVQHSKYSDRRGLGYFFVVDLNGFHSFRGKQQDISFRWENVDKIDRDGFTLIITDGAGHQHCIQLHEYQRIDRLRMECLMHQYWNHHLEQRKTKELATVF